MANGDKDILSLLRTGGAAGKVGELPQVTVTPELRERFNVVKPKQARPTDQYDIRQLDRAAQRRQMEGDQLTQRLREQGVNANVQMGGLSVEETVQGLTSIEDPGARMMASDMQKRDLEVPQMFGGQEPDVSGQTVDEETGRPKGFDGVTPDGSPDAEDIKDIGKGLSKFADALATPGVQKALGQFGIAFAQGRPNEPGTILGQAAIKGANAQMEQNITQAMLSGKSYEEAVAEAGGTPSQETVARTSSLAQRREEQAADEEYRQRRLGQFDEQLGIREQMLKIDKYQALSERMEQSKPDDVESWHYNSALGRVAMEFSDIARETFEGTIQEYSAMTRDPETGFDPEAVISLLPPSHRKRAIERAQGLSKQISLAMSGQGSVSEYIPQFSNAEDARDLPVGTIVQINGVPMQVSRGRNEQGDVVKGVVRISGGGN